MSGFNWLLNFVPVLGVVYDWFKRLFSVKLIAFLALKGILFFLFFKFMPLLFGQFFQWIYNLGIGLNSGIDLSFIQQALTKPDFAGFPGWLFVQLRLGECLQIAISGVMVRLSVKRLPFFGHCRNKER